MSMTTPRLRSDLRSEPVEDAQGVLYFDVSDPKNGGVLRLFDFEWLLALKFDGQRGLDEIAKQAEGELGLAASADDLKVYAERLGQLGLLEGVMAQPGKLPGNLMATAYLQAAGLVARVEVTPYTGKAAAAPAVEKPVEKPVEKLAPPVKTPDVVAAKPAPVVEPQKPVAPVKPAEPVVVAKPIEPVRRTPAREDDDRMGQPVLQLRPPSRVAAESPKPALSEPPAKPTPPVKVAPPVETVAPPVAAPRSNLLEALESLPPPVDEPEAASTPAKIELPPSVTETPSSLLNEVMAATKPEPVVEAKKAPVVPIEVELPPKPVEAPKPVEVAPPVEVAKPVEPPKPAEVAKPVEPPKPVEVAKPAEPPKPVDPQKPATVQPTPPAQEPSGGGGKWVVIVLLLLAIGGAVFWFVVKPMMTKVSVKTAPALLADVTSNFSTPAKVKASEPTVLKLGAAGKVQKLVDEGKSVTAGETLVELDSFAAIGKAQVDAQKALDGLKKKLETGKLKGKAAADLQAKITEKQNKIAELETQGKAARLVAEKDGAVAKVLVKQGQAVTAGTDAVSVADKGLVAELQVPANDSASLSGGQTIALCNTGKTLSIKATIKSVTKQDSQNVVQIALPADAAVKAGDELLVEKGKIEQVASLPATAVVDGKVFIVKDGKVATVAVAVAGQESSSVLVKGLTGGEQVIQARSPELHDGVEVEIAR